MRGDGRAGARGGVRGRRFGGSPMRRTHVWTGLVILLAMPLLVSCSAAGSRSGATSGEAPPSSASRASVEDLVDMDTSAVPEGPTVGEIITVGDFQDVLGRNDLTLAPAN